MKIVIFGLPLTSSWGNGYATTYRRLVRELTRRGHDVHFIERDMPWHAKNPEINALSGARVSVYRDAGELAKFGAEVRAADAVIVGSQLPDGNAVGEWVTENAAGVTAYYDFDTPVTLAKLRGGHGGGVSVGLIPRYQLYLSFTGGPALRELENEWGSPAARALYCSVDPAAYYPEARNAQWDLGYLGTYSMDRQPGLERLLMEPAWHLPERKFVVAGSQYPGELAWPNNVERVEHLPAAGHRRFYNRQRFTLSLMRADKITEGYSPGLPLFEAAACGTPIISEEWPGLEEFFTPGREILIARTSHDVERILWTLSEDAAAKIGQAARQRVLARHTAAHRVIELETYLAEAARRRAGETAAACDGAEENVALPV